MPNDVAWRFDITSVLVLTSITRWWQLKDFLFSSLFGEDEPNLICIFFKRVGNHQLESILMDAAVDDIRWTFDRNVMRHVWSEGASSTADQTRGP